MGTLGSKPCGALAAAGKGSLPPERLMDALEQGGEEEKAQREGQCSERSPEPAQNLPPLCQSCHAQPREKSLPDRLPNNVQSVRQLVQENERYKLLCEDAEGKHWALARENDFQRQILEEKGKEILYLQHQLQNLQRSYNQQIHSLNGKVKQHQENCRALSMKIERVEHLHSQQSRADSGSYQDSAAKPPLLQVAADSVKDAITACASELFSRIKKNTLPINFACMNLDSTDTGQIIKVALQSFLCHALFKGFEDPFFCVSDGILPFVKPAIQKAHLLQVYKRCRDLDARQMVNEEIEFTQFFNLKELELCMQLKEQLLTAEDVQRTEDFITSELRSRTNNYYNKLLRLVKALWVLHKLVFAFEPSAEIFRVGQGSMLDEEFMENVAGDDDNEVDDDNEEDDEGEIMVKRREKRVRFMCVPGFIVRHTVIKSRVVCFGRKENRIYSGTEDPCPMTVE